MFLRDQPWLTRAGLGHCLSFSLFFVRLVGEDHDTLAGCLCIYKCQSLQIAPALKKALSAAHDDRMNHQRKFIKQVVLQQGFNKCGAAGDSNALAKIILRRKKSSNDYQSGGELKERSDELRDS